MGQDQDSAFRFEGRWQDYAPIAFTNLLLTIVTLGIYRFWATTRSRRYLWSRSRFIDETLEWTGTGMELFVGFLLAVVLFGIPFLILQFGVQALALRGHEGIAGLIGIAAFFFLLFMAGVARFRALRYRLSRTFWHGIRGGSDSNGIRYGLSWLWKSSVGVIPFWLLVPWSMVSLWNERWRQMSFGSQSFASQARARPIFPRFLLFYLMPFLVVIVAGILMATFGIAMVGFAAGGGLPLPFQILTIIAVLVGVYLLLGLIALAYYAAFLREAISNLTLGDIRFRFEASTSEWIGLLIVDILLVVCTLGIGAIFLSYRHWKFFITHLEATGEVSLAALGQSTTREPGQGEGLLDAFDLGAF
ncbi:MAG: YjgN family protein [Sphingobium sp.]